MLVRVCVRMRVGVLCLFVSVCVSVSVSVSVCVCVCVSLCVVVPTTASYDRGGGSVRCVPLPCTWYQMPITTEAEMPMQFARPPNVLGGALLRGVKPKSSKT